MTVSLASSARSLGPPLVLAAVTSSRYAESNTQRSRVKRGSKESGMESKISKDEAAWKQQLTQNQYFMTRQKGTEPAFTGEYEDTETAGTYKCVCCGQPLFRSETKYHSGSGWPSFFAPTTEEAVQAETD